MKRFESFAADPALADFVPIAYRGVRMLIRRAYEGAAQEMGLLGGAARVIDRTSGGRHAHPIVELASGERIVVRAYRRGGAMRHLNAATYFAGNRALEELRITAAATDRGVSAPYAVAAVEQGTMIGYTAAIATRWIEGARELADWLGPAEPERRLAALRATGGEIARMHGAGIAHPDMNLRNLLVAPNQLDELPRITIIDFDRAILRHGPVPPKRRERDLRRLARSARKLAAPIGRDGWDAFRSGYGSEWPLTGSLG
jgi:3-deoxy-D-manno-octulosonic acid kinase